MADRTKPITAYKTERQRDWHLIRAMTEEIFARAVANGTHSDGPALTVCQGCRRWVSSISYVTLDHKRLCRDCDPTIVREAVAH
jgi:hypothetical protein